MVFYKGSLTYNDLENMPLDRIIEFNKYATRIQKEIKRKMK